jgi:hypothetical protein
VGDLCTWVVCWLATGENGVSGGKEGLWGWWERQTYLFQTANEFLDLPEHGPAELRDSTSSLSATCLVCGKMVGAESVDVC